MKSFPGNCRPTSMPWLAAGLLFFSTGCATKNYVRQETQKTAATLSARIDNNEKAIQQNTEQIKANANQISELVTLNKQTTQKLDSLGVEIQRVDGKAGQARGVADQAQQTANRANNEVTALDERFQNRNRYTVIAEKFVYFKFNSSELEKTYEQDLIEVAGLLKSNPDAVAAVEGRTDNSGDAEYNIRLGERREDAVVRFLVVQQGVPIIKVHKMSFGEDSPIADNQSKEGRAKNRCAVVRVLAPATGKGDR